MSRIDKVFKKLRNEKRKALVIFLTAGYPGIGATVRLVNAACDAGADIIELGVPFSDPLADGPVIQASYTRAIKKGMNLKKTFETVKKIRATGCETPIVLMVSCTLVINHGVEKFMKDGARAGVDGLILPDVPVEEGDEFCHLPAKPIWTRFSLPRPRPPAKG